MVVATNASPERGERLIDARVRPDRLGGDATRLLAWADWSDITAAMDAVVDRHMLGILQQDAGPVEARFELLDVRGRPIWVVVSRVAEDESGEVQIAIRAGRFGDPALESIIARDLAHRLDQLSGVEFAPIDWPR